MIKNLKLKTKGSNSGVTYVELIVVLSIFAIISAVSLFNYRDFQARIDIKNLANDIALRIVQAQKFALSGKQTEKSVVTPWRPSYGVYFNLTVTGNPVDTGNNIFYSFVNNDNAIPQSQFFDKAFSFCPPTLDITHECLGKITIAKAKISAIDECDTEDCATPVRAISDDLHITFTRPNSEASIFRTVSGVSQKMTEANHYIRIKVESLNNPKIKSSVRVYPQGRVQVNVN